MRRQIERLPAEVKRVRRQLAEWRRQRRRGQRIPEGLWAASVRAARRHGLDGVSQALNLDYYQLKRRCAEHEGCEPGAEVAFVEIDRPKREMASCVVELEKGNGAKLRVCVGDAASVDWCRVKEAFLGA